jgi:hypothetical protein
MSRSNPTDNSPNPSKRWFEWDGSTGNIRYYDKQAKETVVVGDKFTFMLLDQLATVKGWHDASESGIYANEVKDTRSEPLVVKAFSLKEPIAEGFYKSIRDRVIAAGGHFTTNCYIAFKNGADGLEIGSLQFKGAALSAWMNFAKEHRSKLLDGAVKIEGADEGKKGKITFYTPRFSLIPASEEGNQQAVELDKQLQEYLKAYFSRTRVEQAAPPPQSHEEREDRPESPSRSEPEPYNDDSEIPF